MTVEMAEIYRDKLNKLLYHVLGPVLVKQDGVWVEGLIYTKDKLSPSPIYCRPISEFEKEFEKV